MESPKYIDAISKGGSIVYLEGSQAIVSKYIGKLYLKIPLPLTFIWSSGKYVHDSHSFVLIPISTLHDLIEYLSYDIGSGSDTMPCIKSINR